MTLRTLPELGAPPLLAQLPIRTHTFANGLLLAAVERRELPIVDVELVVRAGAALDAPQHAGRAVMVAEMIDEGTASRSMLQIADEIDYLGAQLNVSAGWDTTVLSLHVLSGRLLQALDIFGDLVLNASFPEAEFEKKKRERLTGLLQDRDEARIVANKALSRGVFGRDHPYGQPVGGTYASLTALTLDQVQAFYLEQFTAANAFLVVVGDVDFGALVEAIDARFGQWRSTAAPSRAIPPVIDPQRTRVLLVDKPRAAQAEIRVGHIAPARATPDYFPLVIMNTILGGAFTSRLNLKLREEMGVTYGASSKFGWRKQGGIFWGGAAVDTEAAAESVAVTLREMRRMQEEAIDMEELQRATQYIAFGLPRSFETTEDIAAHLREQLLHGFSEDYWPRYVDRVLAVTPEEVSAAARNHLQPDHAVAVVVADRGQVESELEALGVGEVLLTDVET